MGLRLFLPLISTVIEVEEEISDSETPDLHLIVISALEPTVVYR